MRGRKVRSLVAATAYFVAVATLLVITAAPASAQQAAPLGDPCLGMAPTLVGTEGDDQLTGTDGDDVIAGLAGNDVIDGGAGNDVICGDEGDDTVAAGDGDDTVAGGPGADEITGDAGDDVLMGGDGDDNISGNDGDDTLRGDDGDDHLGGQSGADRMFGGDGDDKLNGNNGPDTAVGGPGDDSLHGNNDDDILVGGPGIDDAQGNNGTDACSAETVKGCETDEVGAYQIDTIPFPADPQPLTFPVNTAGFPGVELTVESDGGLYPWDVYVRPAFTRARMTDVIVSDLIDIGIVEGAPGIRRATLTMGYDEAEVDEMDEAALSIWTYDPELQFWLPLDSTVDTVANEVTATLDHFSIYAVLEIDRDEPEMWRRVIGDTPVFCVPGETGLGVDVVFTIDTSGSMSWNDPRRLRVAAAKAFVGVMRDVDQVGVVSFSSGATRRIALTPLDSDANIAAVNQAIDRTGFASGGTNISAALNLSTSLLANSQLGRPRIMLLLTDGVGTYRTSDAEAAAAANITVYTVGLGGGVDVATLQEIADITGGEFIQLASADQLVPLYEELGGTIIDDGSDRDLDDLTDCVETNGAFVPGVVFGALPNPFNPRLEDVLVPRPAYITTNPDDPDTDGDDYDDGVELVEADLRANPILANEYAFLIESGITRYFLEISDPLDEFDPGVDVPGTLDFLFEPGLLDVDGLRLSQQTLFQPDEYPERPVIDRRYLGDRLDSGGLRIRQIEYTDPPVVYDGGENCVENCDEVERLAAARDADNGWLDPGCAKNPFASDFDCEVRGIIKDARGDQAVFEGDDDMTSYFLQEQVAIECALALRDLDRCVRGAFNIEFNDILPYEVDLIIESLNRDDGRWMFYEPLLTEFAFGSNVFLKIIEAGEVTNFVEYRRHLVTVWENSGYLDTATGPADRVVSESDFYDVIPGLAGTSAELRAAIDWYDENRWRMARDHNRLFADEISLDVIRAAMVFAEAFDEKPAGGRDLLEDFPLVGKGGEGVDIGWFFDRQGSVARLFDRAMLFVGPGDHTRMNEYVARLPDSADAIRNELITALYIEYGQAIQTWLGADRGVNWGLVAPWASNGVRGPIVGEFPFNFAPSIGQAAADGNQWIFRNIGARYAAFVEVIRADPTPSDPAWERFFADNFGPGEGTLRDGFVALVAAKEAGNAVEAQRLLFQSNLLLATHEQEGVQLHLEKFDLGVPPDIVSWWIPDLPMGADLKVNTTDDVYGDLGLNPNGPPPAGNLIWDPNTLLLDPTGQDASFFSVPGFEVAEGQPPTGGVVDVGSLTGIEDLGVPIAWAAWRDAGGSPGDANFWAGTSATVWWDWEERMWYLLNLFRGLHADPDLLVPPAGRGLGTLGDLYSARTLGKLDVG